MPTGTLADYLVAIDTDAGRAPMPSRCAAAAEAVLRKRLVYEGTRLDLSDEAKAPWWLMSRRRNGDQGLDSGARPAGLARRCGQDDGRRRAAPARGHWDTTTANAWGAITVRRFAELYPASAITGVTNIGLAGGTASQSWPLPAEPISPLRVPLAAGDDGSSAIGHGRRRGRRSASRPRCRSTEPLNAGYRMQAVDEIVQGAHKDRADARRRGQGDASSRRGGRAATGWWSAIPFPPGATDRRQAWRPVEHARPTRRADRVRSPSYVERGKDTLARLFRLGARGHPRGRYVVRLNGVGPLHPAADAGRGDVFARDPRASGRTRR